MTKKTFQVLIVDDEPAQQAHLGKKLAENHPELRLIGVCPNVDAALDFLQTNTPDLIFLDMIMPGKTGFELLKELKEQGQKIDFEVVFCTSFDTYAFKAFQYNAIDFLLKPFSDEDLAKVIEKFLNKVNHDLTGVGVRNMVQNMDLADPEKKLVLPTGNGFHITLPRDVIRIESSKSYTNFFLLGGVQVVVSKTIQEYDDLLSDYGFFRIHVSSLVNLTHVISYKKTDGVIRMTDNSEAEVARRRRDEFVLKMTTGNIIK